MTVINQKTTFTCHKCGKKIRDWYDPHKDCPKCGNRMFSTVDNNKDRSMKESVRPKDGSKWYASEPISPAGGRTIPAGVQMTVVDVTDTMVAVKVEGDRKEYLIWHRDWEKYATPEPAAKRSKEPPCMHCGAPAEGECEQCGRPVCDNCQPDHEQFDKDDLGESMRESIKKMIEEVVSGKTPKSVVESVDEYVPETNDIVDITNKTKSGITTFRAHINSVEDRGEYYYVGYIPDDIDQGKFGYTRLYKSGPREYGVQSMVPTGEKFKPVDRKYPNLQGNPGYDLMM